MRGGGVSSLLTTTCHCGPLGVCLLSQVAGSHLLNPPPFFKKAFKGDTFTVYFCPFFFSPLLSSSQFPLLATSLRLICAPVIHDFFFFPLARQSHAGHTHECVC